MKTLTALAAGLFVATSLPGLGQSITWNLGGSGGDGTVGGTRSFTSNGIKVTASAWSYTKSTANNAFEASMLGQYSVGLGVINNEEDGTSPWHQVDNMGQNDYVLFVFDTLVDVTSVRIQASPGPYDQDVSYWTGIVSNTGLNGVTYSGLASLGYSSETVVSGESTSAAKNVAINAPSTGINALLFGPERGLETASNSPTTVDAFKINSLTASKAIPEPSAALLSALGVLGLLIRRRR